MKFKFNIFGFVTALIFVMAFLCLMISYATEIMFYPALLFFEAGFVMLSVIAIRDYLSKTDDLDQQRETIVMELASGENGETYVMKEEKNDRKARRKTRSQKFEKLLPSILCVSAAVLFLYLLINTIAKHI